MLYMTHVWMLRQVYLCDFYGSIGIKVTYFQASYRDLENNQQLTFLCNMRRHIITPLKRDAIPSQLTNNDYMACLLHGTRTHNKVRSLYSVLVSWWRHQMETFSALLVLCAENSLVLGEFPAQRPVKRSVGVSGFFYLRLNKRLSKQSLGWWFETLWSPL